MNKKILLCLLFSCCGGLRAAEGPRAFVAARHIRAGEEIKAEALREVDAAPGAVRLEAGELAGVEAVRPIQPGEKLTRLMFRPVRAVKAGDKIRVRTVFGHVKISAMFTALRGGAKGETIEARNQNSGRICPVKVEGPGEGSLEEAKK